MPDTEIERANTACKVQDSDRRMTAAGLDVVRTTAVAVLSSEVLPPSLRVLVQLFAV